MERNLKRICSQIRRGGRNTSCRGATLCRVTLSPYGIAANRGAAYSCPGEPLIQSATLQKLMATNILQNPTTNAITINHQPFGYWIVLALAFNQANGMIWTPFLGRLGTSRRSHQAFAPQLPPGEAIRWSEIRYIGYYNVTALGTELSVVAALDSLLDMSKCDISQVFPRQRLPHSTTICQSSPGEG